MPELPDIEAYLAALQPLIGGRRLDQLDLFNPFVLRSVDPAPESLEGLEIVSLERLGKRLVLGFENRLFAVIHLMIAGRLRWDEGPIAARPPEPKNTLARFRFESGALRITEAGTTRRASIYLVASREALAAHNPGGIEPLEASLDDFAAAIHRENRTLKRCLTDPATFSGIGNAYSDEILHAARLSPIALTGRLSAAEIARLHDSSQRILRRWTERLASEFRAKFPGPGDVTAFRPGFAVHGRFGKPCPECGTAIQRIVRADNEWNYCPRCQSGGKVLADRSLSRLLKDNWPRTIDELEA